MTDQLVKIFGPHPPQSPVHLLAVLAVVWLNATLCLAADEFDKELPICRRSVTPLVQAFELG